MLQRAMLALLAAAVGCAGASGRAEPGAALAPEPCFTVMTAVDSSEGEAEPEAEPEGGPPATEEEARARARQALAAGSVSGPVPRAAATLSLRSSGLEPLRLRQATFLLDGEAVWSRSDSTGLPAQLVVFDGMVVSGAHELTGELLYATDADPERLRRARARAPFTAFDGGRVTVDVIVALCGAAPLGDPAGSPF